jgi:hypothetical protein
MSEKELVRLVVSKDAWEQFVNFVNAGNLTAQLPVETGPLMSELMVLAGTTKKK